MRRGLIGLSIAAAAVWASTAHAYNNREHERLPDQALQIANILRRGQSLQRKVSDMTGTSVAPLDARPASVPASEATKWLDFINDMKATPDRIAQLRTGLSDPKVPGTHCGNRYPVLAAGQHLATCKAGDTPFAVKRGWGTNTSDCFIRGNYFSGDPDKAEFFNAIPSNYAGALLGYYGQAVDDEFDDSIWWFSTQNQGLANAVREAVADSTEFTLAIALAPFACLWALFSGDNCFDKARDWAHQTNPGTRAEQLARDLEKSLDPGRANGHDMWDTQGVWHFINVEDGSNGDFNRIAGMHYTSGGWRGATDVAGVGRIDAVDFGLIVLGDAIGWTLDPDRAGGVSRYQQSPDGPISRRKNDWYAGIGHTEFEPLDNLALYGWRRFQTNHDASGLGWVLHAIGDSVAPHHGIAATGWGHRPFEDFVGFAWKEMFREGDPEHYFLMSDIIANAYRWWKFINAAQGSGNPNDIPIRELITALAMETRGVSDYAIKTLISLSYLDGSDEAAARSAYGGTADKTRALLQNGTGATLAFLIKASRLIPVDPSASPCACPDGSARIDGTCQPCSTINKVEVNGLCADACPADLPFRDPAGHCTLSCPNQNCTGTSCATDEYLNGTTCVAKCPANTFVVDRECRSSCPPDTVAVSHVSTQGPFYCQRTFCTTTLLSNDSQQICCPSGKGFVDNDICVASCPSTNPFFVDDQANLPFSVPRRPVVCRGDCLGTGHEFFVPNASGGPVQCLTACPSTAPFADQSIGGRICASSCPASRPFHNPVINGVWVDCLASCPIFHDSANQCFGACPPATPFHRSDRLCISFCPATEPFHTSDGTCTAVCPAATPFHQLDGTCVAQCPRGADAGGTCIPEIR